MSKCRFAHAMFVSAVIPRLTDTQMARAPRNRTPDSNLSEAREPGELSNSMARVRMLTERSAPPAAVRILQNPVASSGCHAHRWCVIQSWIAKRAEPAVRRRPHSMKHKPVLTGCLRDNLKQA